VGDPRRFLDLFARRVRPRERNVLGDRSVEQEVVLQHHAELPAVVAEPERREIATVDEDPARPRSVERQDQADERALPAPEEPTSAVVEPAGAWKDTRFRTSLPGVYSKLTFSKAMSPRTPVECRARAVLGVLGHEAADLADAVEPRERFRDLGSDGRDV